MREVLREGRVEVAAVTHSDSVGVGALAGLAGEVNQLGRPKRPRHGVMRPSPPRT